MRLYIKTSIKMIFIIVFVFFKTWAENINNYDNKYFSVISRLGEVHFTAGGDILWIKSFYRNPNGSLNTSYFRGCGNRPLLSLTTKNSVLSDLTKEKCINIIRSEDSFSINIRFECGDLAKTYRISKDKYIIGISCNINYTENGRIDSLNIIFNPLLSAGDTSDIIAIPARNKKVHYNRRIDYASAAGYSWYGVKSRFWVTMTKLPPGAPYTINNSSLSFSLPINGTLSYIGSLYTGPIEYRELKKAGTECTGILYPIWFWMRWLSFGMLYLFDFILHISRNTVLSLISLSICVKIIVFPLFRIADKWQKEVNIQKSLLQPRLDEISREYKGEEKHRRTLQAYKELGINPLYSLKSLLSAAIQIPVFFAAYHMLSEHIALQGVEFLWIKDLSLPDRLFKLPFTVPYFGGYLNILPIIMTLINIFASWIHTDTTLKPELLKKQRQSLYFIAGLFLVLLYTSPAGMVFYWTINNLTVFLKVLYEKLYKRRDAV